MEDFFKTAVDEGVPRARLFFFQQATRVALSTKQLTLTLETKQATLCKTYRRANGSFTTMDRLVGQTQDAATTRARSIRENV